MRNAMIVVLAGTLAGIASGCASDPESEFRGRRLAETNCGTCHAIALFDNSIVEAAPPFRDLRQRHSFDDLRWVMKGEFFPDHPEMPDFEPTPKQVDDIVDYIESIQQERDQSLL